MESYRLLPRSDTPEAEWVLKLDGASLSLTDPDGQIVFEAVPTHRTVNLNELYGEGKISFTTPRTILPFQKRKIVISALRTSVEIGLAGDAESRSELRREALRLVRCGFAMFVVAGGLFMLYCWWAFTYEDPPPGSWQLWVLKWFGWVIHGVLIVLLGLALAGPCVGYSGFRLWLRMWRIARAANTGESGVVPEYVEPANSARPVEPFRLECARCESAHIEKLPPSQISPQPGYVCENCGLKMRAPRMLFLYLVGLALGCGFVTLFLALLLDLDRSGRRAPAPAFMFGGMGLVCVAYSLVQMMRPVPRRIRSDNGAN